MIEAVLVVLSKPLAGRDDDFNDWYTHIHLRDALRFRGVVAAQRFARGPLTGHLPETFDWRYLSLYDVFDPARFSREHWEAANTPRMMITDAFDDSVLEDYHYYPLAVRDLRPGQPHDGPLILERFNVRPGQEAAAERHYVETIFPAAMARPGVRAGALLRFLPEGQLMPTPASHGHVAIYRLDGPATAAWTDAGAFDGDLFDRASLQISDWLPITARITRDAVEHGDAAARDEEARARRRMGNRIHQGGQDKLATPLA